MPLRLEDLAKDERTITVEFEGEELEITYRPGAHTPDLEMRVDVAFAQARSGNAMAEILAQMMIWWDVINDNGENLPVSREILSKTPTAFLTALVTAIIDDMRGVRDDRKNSAAGSPRKAR